VRRKPAEENLRELGKAWGPRKRNVLVDLLMEEGRTGKKRSVPRVAKDAGVSTDFVRSMQAVTEHADGRKLTYTNRERTKALAVIEELGLSEDAFLFRAERYQL
jgi:hypothetical protein